MVSERLRPRVLFEFFSSISPPPPSLSAGLMFEQVSGQIQTCNIAQSSPQAAFHSPRLATTIGLRRAIFMAVRSSPKLLALQAELAGKLIPSTADV